ncbi:hypothetical protein ANN_02881 [Periplaneta americana]|uniref:Uncharacterized protein n=1 Tax=Periplaneta americana TaxID=6978 RepID=A0ABQ8TXJ3_PERAM|nr:hypothetical protein ANN_02881 [Periplaneta americana]
MKCGPTAPQKRRTCRSNTSSLYLWTFTAPAAKMCRSVCERLRSVSDLLPDVRLFYPSKQGPQELDNAMVKLIVTDIRPLGCRFQMVFERRNEKEIIDQDITIRNGVEPISEEEVREALKKSKIGKASGPGGVTAELWEYGPPLLVRLITKMLNQILEGDEIPEDWKISYISAIHKKKWIRRTPITTGE